MLLNIFFGVIIDTFASLRTADQKKITDMQNRCFICSIDAYTFDRVTKRGFHDHIYMEHNMWHYLYLFVHIRKKNITEYNGLELYLAMKMAKKDVSFFPNQRALALEKTREFQLSSALGEQVDDNDTGTDMTRSGSNGSTSGRENVLVMGEEPENRKISSTTTVVPAVVQVDDNVTKIENSTKQSSLVESESFLQEPVEKITQERLNKIETVMESLMQMQSQMQQQQQKQMELLQLLLAQQQQNQKQKELSSQPPKNHLPQQQQEPSSQEQEPSITLLSPPAPTGKSSSGNVFRFDDSS
jgi:hypothetical protein